MAALPPYHLSEQSAKALVNPIRLDLVQIERRLQHYTDRILMADGDREQIRRAHQVIQQALGEIERLGRE